MQARSIRNLLLAVVLACCYVGVTRADVFNYNNPYGGFGFITALEAAQDAIARSQPPEYAVAGEHSRDYPNLRIYFNSTKGPGWEVFAKPYCVRPDSSTYWPNVVLGKAWACECPAGQQWSTSANGCVAGPKNLGGSSCPLVGNPVHAGTGNKFQQENDYLSSSGLTLTRYFNSQAPLYKDYELGYLNQRWGENWRSTFDRRVLLKNYLQTKVAVLRDDGQLYDYSLSGGVFVPDDADVTSQLTQLSSGPARWRFKNAANDETELYNIQGRLISIISRAGVVQSLTYSDGTTGPNGGYVLDSSGNPTAATLPANLLIRVIDSFGRSLSFGYNSGNRVVLVTDPENATYRYAYDTNGNLISVNYPPTPEAPNGAMRQYVYNEPTNSPFTDTNYPHKQVLTGIIDENNSRFATFRYDLSSRAISTQHAGGADSHSIAYTLDASGNVSSSVVTDPLGTTRTYQFQMSLGVTKATALSQPCSGGCGIASATSYDVKGNVSSATDFNGTVTNYTYHPTRNLETSRTEAAGTLQARTVGTQWHSTYHLPTQIDELGKRLTFTHDASGNVLTRTELDTANSTSRTWTYTYNSFGRVLTANGPRTDISDVTTYTYYNCTTGYQCGQVQTITNALGHVTTYNTYNAHGQPLTITDPNGVVTTLTYNARQRSTSRTVGSEQTAFTYWPTGLLKKATLPDGSYLEYAYDAAHRLTGINDAEGNRIAYTLDAMGNRTAENLHDPSNALTQTRTRVFNTLNRLWKEIGAAGTASVTTEFGYDNNGNPTSINAPLSRNTGQTYDELSRLTQVTDPLLGTTQYSYNALDQLISVTDPRSKVTSYTYNALGDLTQQVSPDTGTTTNTYDSAGNLATRTDARGKTATYSYDALNRVTGITYPDQTISYTYDTGSHQKGRLTQVSDGSGSTHWTYDTHGRVLTRQQVVGAVTQSVGYAYDTAGRLQTLTLPSGNTVTYGYTNGKVTSLTLNGSTTLLSNVLYQPFGPTSGWTWGNSTLAVREYDTDGKVTDIDSAGLKTYSYDTAFRITGVTDATNPNLSQSYGYDLLDRLTSATGTGLNQSWTYDANGNRLTQSGTQSSTYAVSSTSNRLGSITGALTRTYSYDNAGNTTGDGSVTFTYNDAGRMVSATKAGITTNYAINALGQRVKKTTAGASTYFVYDEAGHLVGEYDNSANLIQETLWFGDTPVVTLKPSGASVSVFYVHTDHLNTPRRISRPSDNVVVWRWDSDPFGTSIANEDPDGDSNLFAYNLRFPGQYIDTETGLHYNYYRDGYDPSVGRYTQSDPIGLGGGINTYAYVKSNPLSLVDPEGLDSRAEPRPCFVCWPFGDPHTRPPGGWLEEEWLQDLMRPIMETAPGNVADTQIKEDYEKYASAERLCGRTPKDRCTWLEENKSRYRADQVKATQKAWGCRRSRALR